MKRPEKKYKRVDLTNRKFGKLTVIKDEGIKGSARYWQCKCDCGNIISTRGNRLLSGVKTNCGCIPNCKHGEAKRGKQTRKYKMWVTAKRNAKDFGREFSITLDDIIIPEYCPLLGIKLDENATHTDHIPSIDRIDNNLGYTKDNIMIVSWRANRMKGKFSLHEFKLIVENLEQIIINKKIHEDRKDS